MLSLLTAPLAVLWTSAGGVQFAGSLDGPSLTDCKEASSFAALSCAAAHAAASDAAWAFFATLVGSFCEAAADAAAAAHACCDRSFARSTVACVVSAIVPGSSAGPAGG